MNSRAMCMICLIVAPLTVFAQFPPSKGVPAGRTEPDPWQSTNKNTFQQTGPADRSNGELYQRSPWPSSWSSRRERDGGVTMDCSVGGCGGKPVRVDQSNGYYEPRHHDVESTAGTSRSSKSSRQKSTRSTGRNKRSTELVGPASPYRSSTLDAGATDNLTKSESKKNAPKKK